ncbi:MULTISPECIES: flagellar basal body P-ring formation chaperone FlgA [unclassified Arsukibacterium]|uniref:flagellar basal body P-ring formation chaperone FlgA n=1 Tax=unclassified Arsukibacterium TaxID=2635278 RepID=UPI000C95D9EA|nr:MULTISPECIES: flagellar basal body P-ring formation chaperone FlgA [unclassified Arsukibacterium]MAA96420.1 flagella basal body P-ring formation protein FlgA [Rheinheimera sp.]|tara:strand:+ start:13113 stop:13823 length:711 start_codon:yes stop_codon:yes gene_type:complete
MNKYEKFYLIFFISLFLISNLSFAKQPELLQYSPEQLTEMTGQWLRQELNIANDSGIELSVVPLDNRIGDKICAVKPQFSRPQQRYSRQVTVNISCTEPGPWQLYVPVKITEMVEAVTVRQNIATGTVITADMLHVEDKERRFVRGNLVTDPRQIIGARSKRALNNGQLITMQDLCLVCRGDVVTILIDNSGLSVSASGIAEQDGTLGDTIAVQNQQSGRKIQTEVVAVNQVRVKF